MIKNIVLFSLALVVCLSFGGFVVAADSAPTITFPNPLCPGGAGSENCINDFSALIAAVTLFRSQDVGGGLAVIMFVWAGILFLTSGAKPENLGKAKNALLWGVVGVAIAL